MAIDNSTFQTGSSLRSWIISLSVLFFSFIGLCAGLICIYTLPDRSVKPLEGGLFFMSAAIVLVALLLFHWKKETAILPAGQIVIKETVSDKILKWMIALFCLVYAFFGYVLTLTCIYILPDKTTQPGAGLLYFLGGAVVMASLAFAAWKSWTTKRNSTTRSVEQLESPKDSAP